MKNLLVAVLCLGMTGCVTRAIYDASTSNEDTHKHMTSGRIGCAPDDIKITDEKTTHFPLQHTWTAECKGVKYFCTSEGTAMRGDLTCTQAK